MVNYACAFNQSELGKYFEWIIIRIYNFFSTFFLFFNSDIPHCHAFTVKLLKYSIFILAGGERDSTTGSTSVVRRLADKNLILAVVTPQTFTLVKQIYLGKIHQKFPVVNSSRVLFYLGKKFWEGHTTVIGSQGFHALLNFLARKFKKARCSGI